MGVAPQEKLVQRICWKGDKGRARRPFQFRVSPCTCNMSPTMYHVPCTHFTHVIAQRWQHRPMPTFLVATSDM
eukprot:scaffold37722_cov26-Tisochrysis_lutea.AAC.1